MLTTVATRRDPPHLAMNTRFRHPRTSPFPGCASVAAPVLAVLSIAFVLLSACAEGGRADQCADDFACARGGRCEDGVCVSAEPTTRGDDGRTTVDSGARPGPEVDAGTLGDVDPTSDAGDEPDSGNPPDSGDQPDTGNDDPPDATQADTTVVPDADEADAGVADVGTDTGSPDAGEDGGMTPAPCVEQLGACALDDGVRDDGEFWCLGDPEGGVCVRKCQFFGQSEECGGGEVCWSLNVDDASLDVCLPSQCDGHDDPADDCDGGTCLMVQSDVGLCFSAGTLPVGAVCPVTGTTPDTRCGPDSWCALGPDSDTHGVCRSTCDLWAPRDDCGRGFACAPYLGHAGLCQVSQGLAPLDECATPGTWCGPRSICDTVSTGGGTSADLCLNYCRRDTPSDCTGLGTGLDLVCNWYAVAIPRDVGLCLSPCDPLEGCGDPAYACLSGVCVRTCATDAQCAGIGAPGSDWGCLDGACAPR